MEILHYCGHRREYPILSTDIQAVRLLQNRLCSFCISRKFGEGVRKLRKQTYKPKAYKF